MSKYLKEFINGIGSNILQITSISDLPRAKRHGFRIDAANMRKSTFVTTDALRKKILAVKDGK